MCDVVSLSCLPRRLPKRGCPRPPYARTLELNIIVFKKFRQRLVECVEQLNQVEVKFPHDRINTLCVVSSAGVDIERVLPINMPWTIGMVPSCTVEL